VRRQREIRKSDSASAFVCDLTARRSPRYAHNMRASLHLPPGKAVDAVDYLARALKERERQLTRVPSEIYPAAMLYGKALFAAGEFDDASVAFLKAVRLRPSDLLARKARNEALIN